MNRIPLTAIAATTLIASGATATIYDEAIDGDLSNDRFAPTLVSLDSGSNIFTMDVIDSDNANGDLDYFTFTLGAGEAIDSITILESSNPLGGSDSAAFVGLAFDDFFDFDPATFTGDGVEGFVITDSSTIAQNVIADLSGGLSALNAGDYTFWIQQTGVDLTRVSFEINVVPAPASAALLGLFSLSACRRQR